MSKETRTFHIDGIDYSFNFSAFKRFFKTYQMSRKITVTDAERSIADILHLSADTIHGWRFANNGPADIETIKILGDFF